MARGKGHHTHMGINSAFIPRNVEICRKILNGARLSEVTGVTKDAAHLVFHKMCRAIAPVEYERCGGKVGKLRECRDKFLPLLDELERKYEER